MRNGKYWREKIEKTKLENKLEFVELSFIGKNVDVEATKKTYMREKTQNSGLKETKS